MAVSNARARLARRASSGMASSLFGLGLGWNLAFVAATTAARRRSPRPSERGRLVGFSDLLASLDRRGARALGRRRLHGAAASVPLAVVARGRWRRCPRSGSSLLRPPAVGVEPARDRLLPFSAGGQPSAASRSMKTWNAKPGEIDRRLVRRRRRGADPRPARHADRRHAARQGQAAVHAARRHRRLRRRRQRREDRGHRQQARPEDLLPPLRLSRAASSSGRCASSSSAGRPRCCARRSRACSRGTGSRAQQITKLKIYAGPEHPHEAQAPEAAEVGEH